MASQAAIHVDDEAEREYWLERFDVTADELEAAVARVGADPAVVERALREVAASV